MTKPPPMTRNSIPFFLVCILCTASCGETFYYPGIRGAHVPVMVFPPDNVGGTAVYTGIDGGTGTVWNRREKNRYGRLRIEKIRTGHGSGYNMGLNAFRGHYSVERILEQSGTYAYQGFGADVNVCKYFRSDSLEFGLGAYMAWSLEFGDYYSFRKKAYTEDRIDNRPVRHNYMVSLYPALWYNVGNGNRIGLQVAVGSGFMPSISYQNDVIVVGAGWKASVVDTSYGDPATDETVFMTFGLKR
jgi:hypothetical protein